MKEYKVIRSETLSSDYDARYVVINAETGEIVDDAQGYGYRTPQKAHAAMGYKEKRKKYGKQLDKKEKEIKIWMKENKSFIRDMDQYAFEIAKGSWGPEDKFDAKFVQEMLDNGGYKPDFTAAELLKFWSKGYL